MSVSRCIALGRLGNNVVKSTLLQDARHNIFQQTKRHGHTKFYYRQYPADAPTTNKATEFMGAVIWWWVLWHLFTDYHELLGHKFPDPSQWTDEELGVPPLDE